MTIKFGTEPGQSHLRSDDSIWEGFLRAFIFCSALNELLDLLFNRSRKKRAILWIILTFWAALSFRLSDRSSPRMTSWQWCRLFSMAQWYRMSLQTSSVFDRYFPYPFTKRRIPIQKLKGRVEKKLFQHSPLCYWFVTPVRLELTTQWLRVICSTNWATESIPIKR